MNSLQFLTSEAFNAVRLQNNAVVLSNTIPGLSAVLFYSPNCPYSQNLVPQFMQLPAHMTNVCVFGIVNISQNKRLITLSQTTQTPIEFVPLIIIYHNGIPICYYDKAHDANSIGNFIYNKAREIPQQSFSNYQYQEQHYNSQQQYNQQQQQQQYQPNSSTGQGLKNARIVRIPRPGGIPLYGENQITYLTNLDLHNY